MRRLWVAIGLTLLAGCAQPLDVKVLSKPNRQPVADARVQRMDLQRPYFITGCIVPVEEKRTGADGLAHLEDRDGMFLRVYKPGFASSHRKMGELDPDCQTLVVTLTRANNQPSLQPSPPSQSDQ